MIVVDASVLVDVLLTSPGIEQGRAMLTVNDLHAPGLLDYEVTSVVRGLTLAGRISPARALDLLSDFDDLTVVRWAQDDALRRRAFHLRHNMSAYDAAYVVLAEALQCPLVTRDVRLSKAPGHEARVVVV